MRRLLVPLADRSADPTTLQRIAEVARSAGATVRLLYVRPLVRTLDATPDPSSPDDDGARRCLDTDESRYLDAVAATLGDIPVERVVRRGTVETAILKEAAAWPADLVALSAGDRTWLSRAVRMGTAAEAFRETGLPALLYTAWAG